MSKYGPLNAGRRLEMGFAMLASLIVRITGGRSKMEDFMFWGKPEEDEGDATLEDIMRMLTAGRKR